MRYQTTTPFGRRTVTLGMMATQIQAKNYIKRHSEAIENNSHVVHKWKVFDDLTEAKELVGVTDRALTVLNALLSFHQEISLGSGSLIVFPSNDKLSQRAHGMSHVTLRRHLACLVKAGVIIRRDSPNGKRYARRGEGGEPGEAFGFDLSPLVVRASEFGELADQVRSEKKALRLVRGKITLVRRDITKSLILIEQENIPGSWNDVAVFYQHLTGQITRLSTRSELEEIFLRLEKLADQITEAIENFIKDQKMNGNDDHFERHIQYSNTESFESELNGFQLVQDETEQISEETLEKLKRKHLKGFTLGLVLEACPDIHDYTRNKIISWREFWSCPLELVRLES